MKLLAWIMTYVQVVLVATVLVYAVTVQPFLWLLVPPTCALFWLWLQEALTLSRQSRRTS